MKTQPANTPALLFHKQAVDHFRGGRMAEGIAMLRKALELNPGSGEMHSHLAIALFQTGDKPASASHFEKSVRLAPRNPEVLDDYGSFLLDANRPQDAERFFRKAVELKPDFAGALLNLGRSLKRQGRSEDALVPLLASLRFNPRSPEALYNIGMMHLSAKDARRDEEGRRYLEQALAINPKHEQAWSGLIGSYERLNDFDMEEKTVARAEKHIPQSAELGVIKVNILIREGRKNELPALLAQMSEKLRDPQAINPVAMHDLGKAYDEIGDPASAMRWFRASSQSQMNTYDDRRIDQADFLDRIEGYRQSLPKYSLWRPAPPLPPDRASPVFLVGFPRSGTTLLDQIFSGHAAIDVAEEKPALRAAEIQISAGGNKPEWELLHKIDEAGIEAARAAYFSTMEKGGFSMKPGHVFIDKMPLNLVLTPAIMRLFPDARFILALRHPCDCVLSNYMQRFAPNDAMAHMVDLSSAAKLYDLCFSAWEDAVQAFGLKAHVIKYENVVADMKTEIVKALDFLGLDWQDSVAAFDETAKKRVINTPSRRQVTQKLYTKARGRWHKYREYMGDVPEKLRPWAEKFGYAIDE